MTLHSLMYRTGNGEKTVWTPTTLDRIGKSEEFLEELLAETPSLLGLESRRSGIRQPFKCFRQLPLITPSGRTIYPDIVFLAASGHVIVVEVKRYINSELRDRSVIAQIIDYAASFSALPDERRVKLFQSGQSDQSDWHEMVRSWFPDDENPDELAESFLERMKCGELNLVIACDKIPPGTADMVASIASQRALGFDLDLVETCPFVCSDINNDDIMFASSTWLETRIVGRTAVTVNYRQGDVKPSTTVLATPLGEFPPGGETEAKGRLWSEADVETEISILGDKTVTALLDFAKSESTNGKYVPSGRRFNPSFIFYLEGRDGDGVLHKRVVFSYIMEWNAFYVYLNSATAMLDNDANSQFVAKLVAVFGDALNVNSKVAGLPIATLTPRLDQFLDAMRWLKSQMAD